MVHLIIKLANQFQRTKLMLLWTAYTFFASLFATQLHLLYSVSDLINVISFVVDVCSVLYPGDVVAA